MTTTRRSERRATAASWTATNPILAAGEWGIEISADPAVPHRAKLGDGVTPWTTLPYLDAVPVAGLAAETAARIAADEALIPLTQKGAANGVATLDADAKIPGAQLPSLAIGETFTVTSPAAMLALVAQRGDVAVRTDLDPDGFFLLTADDPTVLANWVQITAPTPVTSVDGQVGAVALSGTYALRADVLDRMGTQDLQAESRTLPSLGDTSPVSLFEDALVAASTQVAIGRVGNNYKLMQSLGSQRWLVFDYHQATVGSYTTHGLFPGIRIEDPMLTVALGDASIVRTGAGWTLSGDYRTNVTGSAATFTTPADATKAYFETFEATNMGIHLVEIDGSRTRATLVTTAQELVNAGQLASTALVANGGTLNPTDRVLNAYGPSGVAKNWLLADDLTSGVHTVRLTVTGYKQAASADTRLQQRAFGYATAATAPDTAGIIMVADPRGLLKDNSSSSVEYAMQWYPTGGLNKTFKGGPAHGYDDEQTLYFTVDAQPVVLTDPSFVVGTELTANRRTIWRTPDAVKDAHGVTIVGATDMAICNTEYRLTTRGLIVSWETVWRRDGAVDVAYPAMLALNGGVSGASASLNGGGAASAGRIFNRGRTRNGGAASDLTINDASKKANSGSTVAWLWDVAGIYGACFALGTLEGVNGFGATGGADKLYIEDRSDGIDKVYAVRRMAASESFRAGDVWRSQYRVMIARFADANATLATA